MLKTVVAHTYEADEPELAAAEILEQLDLERNLRAHAAGILTCHVDFIDSGVVETLCAKLPFPVVGITTLGSGSNAATDLFLLTLCLLTSDEVALTAACTASLQADQETNITNAYNQALERLPGKASLVLAYAPMLSRVGGEKLLKILDKVSGQTPIFGTMACDHNYDFHDAQTIFNGRASRENMAFIVASGPVNPKFLTISVPEDNIQKQKAIITASEGNVLIEVNNRPVLDYLESLGLSREDGLEGSKTIPIILDYNDGTQPVARCFYLVTPEGQVACGGDMPVNATFALCSLDRADVLTSAGQLCERLGAFLPGNGMLIVSCIGRSVTLGIDRLAEARRVQECVSAAIPYQLVYSGGEICPVYEPDGQATANRFHNFSFNVCLF